MKELSLHVYDLLENSIAAKASLIELTIRDSIKDNIYHFTIKDNGKGMREWEVKNIFEEGFRGSNSEGKTGTGYGLHDVKAIVERYGGTIEISSREKAGFAVYMLFPAYEEEKGSDA